MNLLHFFTLGYFQEYLIFGIILGFIIGIYAFFRVKYALNDSNFSKNKRMIVSGIIAILAFVCCLNIWSNAAVFTFYLFLSSLCADIIRILYKYLLKDKHLNFVPKLHKKGFLALIFFAIIVISGVYGMGHVELTEYNITTDKINGSYSVVWISDIHYGTVQNPKLVNDTILKINDLKPDIVVLGGDIVDDRTTNHDMKEIFKDLGRINSTYGTFFIFGNHDIQPYATDYENGNRTFTDSELNQSITENGIKILKDEKIRINDDVVLVGRADAGWFDDAVRPDVKEMINESDLSKYVVVLDHQPDDCEENSKIGVDLQVSGHTHGGQVFPYAEYENLMGMMVYGEYDFGDMKEIISSGLGGWGWPMRNEGKCEYVLININ